MKLCKSMVAPERGPLGGLVEIDETTIALRTKADPPAGGQGRSHEGKLLLAGAVEITQHGKAKPKLGRIRLASIADLAPQVCTPSSWGCRARRRRQNRWLAGLCWRT